MRNVVPRDQIAPLLDQATGLMGATGSRGRIVVRMYGRDLELAPNPGRVARRILGIKT